MLILWKARQKDADGGFARTFLTQLEQVLGTCLDRGIRVVSNAGGLNPTGLAGQIGALAERLGLHPRVAAVHGDDLLPRLPQLLADGVDLAHLDTGQRLADAGVEPVSANALPGRLGHRRGAGRRGARRGHRPGHRRRAGGRVRGLVGTDGAAPTGTPWPARSPPARDRVRSAGLRGQLRLPRRGGRPPVPGLPDRRGRGRRVQRDHQARRHRRLVSVGTVTAQLLYEIDSPVYANPDVVADFASCRLTQQAPDRVLISGTRGSAPPDRLKVALNHLGGYRNTMTLVLTGWTSRRRPPGPSTSCSASSAGANPSPGPTCSCCASTPRTPR